MKTAAAESRFADFLNLLHLFFNDEWDLTAKQYYSCRLRKRQKVVLLLK